jgi:hypothetical protein
VYSDHATFRDMMGNFRSGYYCGDFWEVQEALHAVCIVSPFHMSFFKVNEQFRFKNQNQRQPGLATMLKPTGVLIAFPSRMNGGWESIRTSAFEYHTSHSWFDRRFKHV